MLLNLIFTIIYKILNIILLKVSFPNKINTEFIVFDLTHDTDHLGDRLFLIDIFTHFLEEKKRIPILENDHHTEKIFQAINDKYKFEKIKDANGYTPIVLQQSFLSALLKYRKIVVPLKFSISYELDISIQYYEQLIRQKILSLGVERKSSPTTSKKYHLNTDIERRKIVFLSPFVNSGRFRITQNMTAKLIQKAQDLQKSGYEIYLIGSNDDTLDQILNFEYKDWRGKIEISKLVDILKGHDEIIVVSYDSFWMLLAVLFNRNAYVVSRKRFGVRSRRFHERFIDQTTLHKLYVSKQKLVHYL